MMKYFFYILLLFVIISCDVTKKVPNESYLLNEVKITTDTKGISESDLKPFLRQKPNSSMLLLGRVKLHAYSIPNNDSTWLNRLFLKLGEPPVLYSDRLAGLSMEQIRLQLENKGYLNAKVDTIVVKKDRKADVTYQVMGNDPYLVRTFTDTIHSVDTTVYNILNERKRLNIMKKGDIFDKEVLESGRIRMTTELRNNGYYNFSKDNFYYLVDSTLGTHQVDITLGLNNPTDSTLHNRYVFGNVIVNNGIDASLLQDSSKRYLLDTIQYRDIKVVQERNKFMLPQAIFYNTFVRPNRVYSDRLVERTYSSLNRLGSVSQTAINLTPVVVNDTNYIDANISIYPGNMHYMQFGVDGTNSAGDLGIAADATYEHKNALKGGETFRLKLNGAYEFIAASDSSNNYYEYGVEAFLSVPQLLLPWVMKQLKDQPSASTEFSVGVNFQSRREYLRQFFNLSSRFQWSRLNWQLNNVVEPLGITYVRMPRMSDDFREEFMNDSINPILKASYEEQLIVRSSYNTTYSNVSSSEDPPRLPFRIRAGVEVSGYLPRLVSTLGGTRKNASGRDMLLGIPYAEYVKTDFDFAPTYRLDDKNTLAGHLALGVAYPYGNSIVLPFEKRYYGGGANSVRGWSTRTLGPGTYNNDKLGYDFTNKTGDVKIDMSVEYRNKLTKLFELAGFIDVGNVWTIKDYSSQPGGYFRWNSFYKEFAAAYGLGVRLDLNFLLLRFDMGMKAHNPALPEGERWTIFKPDFRRDFAFHFAIGYPF
ncbi:MAG TPA: BamA/TamA family outer membrane protein [Petrimonas sp.]|uniref:translocation and assembly module lipoprotein TamL n=1 Tax=Petrimonas sp. TaxID=2023866 RepID=UPI000AF8EE3B|nr:BamA/TamA family outer membrane protein [Petrimonas sp.]